MRTLNTFLLTAFFGLTLSTASFAKEDTNAPAAQSDACYASQYQNLIGKTESDLAEIIFKARRVRVLANGYPATMDYSEQRLNVLLDDAGKVSKLYCG